MKISLTANERALASMILGCCNSYFQKTNTTLTIRFAGGWVRDKLLGLESDDIDVAIDKMTGYEFANILHANSLESKLTKIDANPDKSKHLETATMKLLGLELDFVNLRAEDYHDASSRIPQMSFGTAEQDALRRDITINSLFYNLHTDSIEDLTNKGLLDLQQGICRTPMDPRQTFLDDPLRVLRIIRFATRLGYTIEHSCRDAAVSEDIRSAFSKISRERVGIEVNKMFKGPDPLRAVRIIQEFKLYDIVFATESRFAANEPYALNEVNAVHWLLHSYGLEISNPRLLYLAATLLPLVGKSCFDAKGKVQALIKYVIVTSIKLPIIDGDRIHSITEFAAPLRSIVDRFLAGKLDRQSLGLFLRKPGMIILGSEWRLVVALAAACELAHILPVSTSIASLERVDVANHIVISSTDETRKIVQRYTSFVKHVESEGLQDVHAWRPILDGRQVQMLFKIPKGPGIGVFLSRIMEWQLTYGGQLFDSNGIPTLDAQNACIANFQE